MASANRACSFRVNPVEGLAVGVGGLVAFGTGAGLGTMESWATTVTGQIPATSAIDAMIIPIRREAMDTVRTEAAGILS